jgi:hypothetical protein
VKLYFDEDSGQHDLINALRREGLDVQSTAEAGMNGRDDDDQLIWAATQGRIMVSANVGDFVAVHSNWVERGRPHAGIILIHRRHYSLGEIVRRLVRARDTGRDFRD